MSAKSVPYAERIASVTRSPISDSHARPSIRPVDAAHASPRGMTTVDLPTSLLKIGASWLFRASIFAWIAAFGVTPMFHGLWKSAVL